MQHDTAVWIDTHVHWDAAEFDDDRDQALIRAKRSGVLACLNPCVTVDRIEQVRQLAEKSQQHMLWPRILPAYGIHPLHIGQTALDDLEKLERQLVAHRPAAIGEVGLDGYPGASDIEAQKPWFEAQLELAAAHGLPVLLHSRRAVEAVTQSLKRVQGSRHRIPGGIAHAFNGSESQAQQLIQMGFLLGFGGSLTYEGSTRIRRLAAQLPLTHIVLETDAPDMSPVWLRGARNESAELPKIAHVLAELRSVPIGALSEQTCTNVRQMIAGAR